MSKRNFGVIKSILHFDYPYYGEPNDGLGDEANNETWTRVGNTKLAGSKQPYDVSGAPKFGYRCAYFSDTSSKVSGTNASGIFNLVPSGAYEIEAFVKYSSSAGAIFTFGDLILRVETSRKLTLTCTSWSISSITSTATLTASTWQHVLLRIKDATAKVFLDGTEIISAEITGGVEITSETVTLGGYVGYMDEFVFKAFAGSIAPRVPTEPYKGILDISKIGGYGTGADGDITITANTIINSYGMISAVTDTKTFSVSSWNNGTYTPAVGSEIMLHITRSKSGNNAQYPYVGLYAFAKIASVDGVNVILDREISIENKADFTLSAELISYYYVQVITVPNFVSLTINSGIAVTPRAWNAGYGGGIVAFRCLGDCTVNGSITTFNYGITRCDLTPMENSKLIDRFLCAKGGGAFITCGGTATIKGTIGGGGPAGYGGGIGGNSSRVGYGTGASGISGAISAGYINGKEGSRSIVTLTPTRYKNGSSQPTSGTNVRGTFDNGGAAGGAGAPGGNGANGTDCNYGYVSYSGPITSSASSDECYGSFYFNNTPTAGSAGGAGSCFILIATKGVIQNGTILTGGSNATAGSSKFVWDREYNVINYMGSNWDLYFSTTANSGSGGGGGTGFCYMAIGELFDDE